MKYLNFTEENKLHKKGFEIVIGVDEVGRGPLAGPVVACAFVLLDSLAKSNFSARHGLSAGHPRARKIYLAREFLNKVKDSKQLSEKQREEVCAEILKCSNAMWGIGQVSEKMIDKINILQATKLAMQKSVKNLISKIGERSDRSPFFVVVDGNMRFDENWFGEDKFGKIKYKSIVKGDQKVYSIALASIIAKVYRDNLMKKYAKKYPQYGFEIHKGYGTKKHYENLAKFGACKIHRKTFL